MKIWAKVTASKTEKGDLIRIFGEEFSSKNGIIIQDDVVIVELEFEDKPPQKILEAIALCNVIVFKSGELSKECLQTIEEYSTPSQKQVSTESEQENDSTVMIDQKNEKSFSEKEPEVTDFNTANVQNLQVQELGNEEQHVGVELEEPNAILEEAFVAEDNQPEEFVSEATNVDGAEATIEKKDEPGPEKSFEELNQEEKCSEKETGKAQRKSRFATTSVQLEEKVKEFAENAATYDDFVEDVEKWLKLDSNRRGFVLYSLIVIGKVAKLTWSNLEAEFVAAGFEFDKSDKRVCEKKLAAVCDGEANFLGLLKLLDMYKTFEFNGVKQIRNSIQMEVDNCLNTSEKADEPSSTSDVFSSELELQHIQSSEDVVTITVEESSNQERGVLQKQPKMECMPEIKELTDALIKAAQEQEISEKINIVLEVCGLKSRKPNEQKYILAIASAAVEMDQLDIENLISRSGVPNNSAYSVRMSFAQMINNFVQKNNHTRKIKLEDFLRDLKQIVLFR